MKVWSQDQIDNVSAIDIVRFLQCCRLDLSTEKHLQHDIEQALQISCLSFEREKRLSERDIPDFFVKGGIVIECKMRNKSRKIDIYKQISRYASYYEVKSIVLASNVSMGLPSEINGKPIYAASLSRGWM